MMFVKLSHHRKIKMNIKPIAILGLLPVCFLVLITPPPLLGQWEGRESVLKDVEKTFGDPPDTVRLDPDSRVWVDKKHRRVVVDGFIALQNGQLEMMVCIASTKEHESVVAVFSKAQIVHAGLLAIGAKPGTPVKWEPEYQPPTGSEIQVFALWKDKDGNKKNIDVRNWARVVGEDDKVLDTNFVFAGSMMWKDPDTGQERYMAENGDLICVSNFATATLDVPIKSSDINTARMFATYTDRIPERGTPVRLVLQLVEPQKTADARSASSPPGLTPSSTTTTASPKAAESIPGLEGLSAPPNELVPPK